MEKYKILLFDLDDTILSFEKAEEYAIKCLLEKYNIAYKCDYVSLYKEINLSYWKRLEKKEITREYLIKNRFKEFFEKIGYDNGDVENANDLYFSYLTSKIFYVDGAVEAVRKLKEKYNIYIITNGYKVVQDKRLALAKELNGLYDKVFISEEVGYPKPDERFMDAIIKSTNENKKDMLIIGDSISSDMMFGINTGVDTCFFNPSKIIKTVDTTYEVHSYKELLELLY